MAAVQNVFVADVIDRVVERGSATALLRFFF